jgi:hypothetical protein
VVERIKNVLFMNLMDIVEDEDGYHVLMFFVLLEITEI